MGILFFLSHAVEVPDSDEAVAAMTRDNQGKQIHWSESAAGTFRVRASETVPTPDSIRTYYRGHWFYIEDTDLESKATLTLLSQLFAIHSEPVTSFAPVLTLPAGDPP